MLLYGLDDIMRAGVAFTWSLADIWFEYGYRILECDCGYTYMLAHKNDMDRAINDVNIMSS